MSHFDDAVNAIRQLIPEYRDRRIKLTGFLDHVTGTVLDDPTFDAKPGYLWVHGYPRGANVQVIAGTRINPRFPNVRVWVGENHARQAVAFDVVTDDNAVQQFGKALPAIATNPTPIDVATTETPLSLIGGLRALPLDTSAPGLTVYIEGLPEVNWAGAPIDVDPADLPANPNEFRWAVFYTPAYSGAAVTPTYALTASVVKASMNDLLLSDAANLSLPVGAIRGGAVSLAYGETDLTASNSRFENELRRNFVPEGIVGGISPLTTKGDLYGFDTANARIPVGADGQVLTANSSDPLGVSWEPGDTGGLTLIAAATLSVDTASVSITSISGSYKLLRLELSLRSKVGAASDELQVQANGDSGAGDYQGQRDFAQGSYGANQNVGNFPTIVYLAVPGNNATAAMFCDITATFNDYVNSNRLITAHAEGGFLEAFGSGNTVVERSMGCVNLVGPLTRIDILCAGGNIAAHSSYALYGLS